MESISTCWNRACSGNEKPPSSPTAVFGQTRTFPRDRPESVPVWVAVGYNQHVYFGACPSVSKVYRSWCQHHQHQGRTAVRDSSDRSRGGLGVLPGILMVPSKSDGVPFETTMQPTIPSNTHHRHHLYVAKWPRFGLCPGSQCHRPFAPKRRSIRTTAPHPVPLRPYHYRQVSWTNTKHSTTVAPMPYWTVVHTVFPLRKALVCRWPVWREPGPGREPPRSPPNQGFERFPPLRKFPNRCPTSLTLLHLRQKRKTWNTSWKPCPSTPSRLRPRRMRPRTKSTEQNPPKRHCPR